MMTLPLPLTLLALLLIGFCLINLTRWILATRSLRGDAQNEYANRSHTKPATIEGVSKDDFIKLYVESFQPRWALYAAGATACVIVASPILLLGTSIAYQEVWRMNGSPNWGGAIGYVYMFSLAFGVALLSAIIVAVFARQYHTRTPEPFHHALARARGEPLPEETTWRRRPKWARNIKRPQASSDQTD